MRFMRIGQLATLGTCIALVGCGGDSDSDAPVPSLPQLSQAKPGTLASCEVLATQFQFANTRIAQAVQVPAGELKVAGKDIGEHCLIQGAMHERQGANGAYAIGFEMRLPRNWNGRFFYQANGGTDGSVATATGGVGGGGSLTNALHMGFAVISSDAGHNGAQNAAGVAHFGVDPQSRLDYGYQAVGKLTPMAKSLLTSAYGRGPDRSYIGGCSNGGRHTMVAASRYAQDYDGFLVGNAGFNLPLAATANIGGFQKYARLATSPTDAGTGFTAAERTLVADKVLDKCDALDGLRDGLIQDTAACQAAFDLQRDVPTCTGERDGTCLSADQKTAIADIFAGVKTETGQKIYASWPFDNGIQSGGWAFWKFTVPAMMDSVAVGQIWMTPPQEASTFNPMQFAATANLDNVLQALRATSPTYAESALSFMNPPEPTSLQTLKQRGAKLMAYHGTADPIFSSNDLTQWYEGLRSNHGGDASDFARFYTIPGMGHCSGGPSTDQFDMLTPLVEWVEQGKVPQAVVASARGAGNPGGANAEIPANWSANRTRPLCPYPQVARFVGPGDGESASQFVCR